MRVPIPLRGPLSIPFRAFGVRPSRMNPNLCTICELSFTKVMRARKVNIDATILFADLRGYTGLSQSLCDRGASELVPLFSRSKSCGQTEAASSPINAICRATQRCGAIWRF